MDLHRAFFFSFAFLCSSSVLLAGESIPVWPDLAPGETTRKTGTPLPPRETDSAPITRVENITSPTLDLYPADPKIANGTGVLILPGGGFGKVVPDLEGSEAAMWLNSLGISAYVLNYRTTTGADAEIKEDPWLRPVQDSERALRLLRAKADEYSLETDKIGLLGFSAGGQVAAIHATNSTAHYDPIDEIDKTSQRPDFLLLVYPWRVYIDGKEEVLPQITPTTIAPPPWARC